MYVGAGFVSAGLRLHVHAPPDCRYVHVCARTRAREGGGGCGRGETRIIRITMTL